MKFRKIFLAVLICPFLSLSAQDTIPEESCHHGEFHFSSAPISIMGEHLHEKGGFMLSYTGMGMNMDKTIKGSSFISEEAIYNEGYMMAPQAMQMQMHMLGVMYSPSDKVTLMAMANYRIKNMDSGMRMGIPSMYMYTDFSTSSVGIGDISLSAMIGLLAKETIAIHANVGVLIPSGSIEQHADTPMQKDAKLPYAMQLGSGTLDTHLGLTITGNFNKIDWGFQPKAILRMYENKEGYQLGNNYITSTWLAYWATDWFSFSASASGSYREEIKGVDTDLNPMMSPLANTNNSGGSYVYGGLGLNFYLNNGFLAGTKIAIEGRAPLYYNTNGIQMYTSNMITFGVQYTL